MANNTNPLHKKVLGLQITEWIAALVVLALVFGSGFYLFRAVRYIQTLGRAAEIIIELDEGKPMQGDWL